MLPYNGKTIGKASIEVTQAETNSIKGDAEIIISTRDFEVVGTLKIQDGLLTWGEIEDNAPAVVARVELNPTTLEIEQGKSKTVEVKCYNSSNNLIPTRKLGEISITRKSGSTKVTVTQDTTYKNKATINVAGDQEIGENKAVITATVGGVEAQEAKRCTINVKEKTQMIGSFIEYNVSYTDMYVTTQTFTKTNGWRILYAEEDTAHPGQYKNVKIVSTGIPAKLYYSITADANSNKWWGTSGNTNVKATYGLKYNFTSIPMSSTSSPSTNAAGYGTITNGDPVANVTNTANGSIFITSKAKTEDDANTTEIESVHALTLEELNTARNLATNNTSTSTATTDGAKGLFYLRNLSQLDSSYGYTSSTSCPCWLASPSSGNTISVWFVRSDGSIYNNGGYAYGVRPVVSLKSNIQQNSNGDWVIVE